MSAVVARITQVKGRFSCCAAWQISNVRSVGRSMPEEVVSRIPASARETQYRQPSEISMGYSTLSSFRPSVIVIVVKTRTKAPISSVVLLSARNANSAFQDKRESYLISFDVIFRDKGQRKLTFNQR